MKEEDTNSSSKKDEFSFSFEVSPYFYQNFTSYPILAAKRIQNNILLSSSMKISQLQALDELYSKPVSFKQMENQSPTTVKLNLNEVLEKTNEAQKIYTDLAEEKTIVDTEKTKSFIVANLGTNGKNFKENVVVFLLNNEWIEKKRIEEEIKRKREEERIKREMLNSLSNPYFKLIVKNLNKIGQNPLENKEKLKLGLDAKAHFKIFKKMTKLGLSKEIFI